jgi:hypothetical protein
MREPVEHRMRLPPGTPLAPLTDLCAGVTAGLAEHLHEVQAIDATGEAGTVRLLHAAVDADGVPLTVESVVSTGDDVHCRLFPTTGAGRPLAVEIDLSGAVTGRVERYGPHARVTLPGPVGPVFLPAAAVPGWLFALLRLGPRPQPAVPGIRLATVDGLPARTRLDWAAGVVTEPGGDVDLTATGRLDLIDADGAGLWLVSPLPPDLREDGVPADAEALRPFRPADLWDHLVLLLA